MTITNLKVAPEYNSIYLSGRHDFGDVPLSFVYHGIAATRHCINIPTTNWNDGHTAVTIGRVDDVAQVAQPTYDGVLETPESRIILSDSVNLQIESIPVPTLETRVRVWTDHPTEPENIVIGWG